MNGFNAMTLAVAPKTLVDLVSKVGRSPGKSPVLNPGGLPAIGSRNNALASLAGSLVRKGTGFEVLLDLLLGANDRFPEPLPEEEVRRIAESIIRYDPALELSEQRLSEQFAARNGERLRFSPSHGWMVFDGTFWARDVGGLRTQELVKNMLTELRESIENVDCIDDSDRSSLRKTVRGLEKRAPINNIYKLAASAPDIFDDGSWDDPAMLVNFRNGTLHLPEVELRPHDSADRLTQVLPYDYDPSAKCPNFEKVLADVLEPDVVAYLQRLFGYALTGSGQEHIFPILIGAGRNGKSTIVEAIAHALGSYATVAAPSTFLKGKKSAINNDVAALAGARFVRMSELNAGEVLDAALVKQFTGGDAISARFLHQEHFKFTPVALIAMLTNAPPVFDGSDSALARRLVFVRFGRVIPPQEVDTKMPDKLRTEAAGIMNWMLRGFLEYHRLGGLRPPKSVVEDTDEFIREANQVLQFLQERCEIAEGSKSRSADLYAAYRHWATASCLQPMTIKAFNPALERTTGSVRRRTSEGWIWTDIRIKIHPTI